MNPYTASVICLVMGMAGAVLIGGTFAFKSYQQTQADHMRRTFEVTFPRGMGHDSVLEFIRQLGGLPKPTFLKPVYAISLEMYADVHGKHYYLSIPGHVQEAVDDWLTAHIEGASLEPVRDEDDLVKQTVWDHGMSLRMSGHDTPLMIQNAKHVSAGIASSFDSIPDDGAVILQWMIFRAEPQNPNATPTKPWWTLKAEDHSQHKAKVSDKTFNAITRIGAKGEDAKRLARGVYSSLSRTHAYGVSFRPVRLSRLSEAISGRKGVLVYPVYVNAGELSALLGWPFDDLNTQMRARKLEPNVAIPTEGIVIGTSNYTKAKGRQLAVPPQSLNRHAWVLGPTGSGKSVMLHNIAVQVMDKGMGLVVIEPKGDLAHDILLSVPKSRVDDVIWFDPTDITHPIGLNVLSGEDYERTTGHVVDVFQNRFSDSWGQRLEWILRLGVKTAAMNGLTLYDVRHMLINPDFRRAQVRLIKNRDRDLYLDWSRLDGMADSVVDSVINKLDGFLGSRAIKNIVGQKSGLDMTEVVRDQKILLMPLPGARLGQANAAALGSLVREMLWDATLRRPPDHRELNVLMMDEFQNYAGFNTSKSDAFAEARSYGLGLVIANQHLGQLPKPVLDSVKQNTRTKLVFGTGPDDAAKLANNFSPLNAEDLQSPAQYNVAATLMTDTGTFTTTAKAAPPPMPTGQGRIAMAKSRAKYGRPVREVEAELTDRHKSEERDRRRPSVGREA